MMEEASIQFADAPLHNTRSNKPQSVGGVVPLRSNSRLHGGKNSLDGAKVRALEEGEDEDAGLRDERDYKRSQVSVLTRVAHWFFSPLPPFHVSSQPTRPSVLLKSLASHTNL